MNTKITVSTSIQAPLHTVWKAWSEPEHIKNWNFASDDWHTPQAENDLRPGGRFSSRMEAKDGSFGFDFGGTYDTVQEYERIQYTLDDGRNVDIRFSESDGTTTLTEEFDAETENPVSMQRDGWQSILDNFKTYVSKLQ